MLLRSGRRAARSCLGAESSRLVSLGVLSMHTKDCSFLQITVWGEGVQEEQCEGEVFLWQLVSPPHTHALKYTTCTPLPGVSGHRVLNTICYDPCVQ